MRLRIAVDGKERDVSVDGEPPDLRVAIDGREVPVRLALDGATAIARVGDREIRLDFGGGVRVNGVPRRVEVAWVAEESGHEGPDLVDVRPPMPGRIVRVAVKAGDSVRRGAPLAVLEAMKMQNEIPAPVAGVVREVLVREGDQVSGADVVVRIGRASSGKP